MISYGENPGKTDQTDGYGDSSIPSTQLFITGGTMNTRAC